MRTTLLIAPALTSFIASAGLATAAPNVNRSATPYCLGNTPNLMVSATGFAPWDPREVFFNVTNASCTDVRTPFVVVVKGFVDQRGYVRPGVKVIIDALAAGQTRTILAETACETARSIAVDTTNTVKETSEGDNTALSPWFIC
jgi:hypothetical protein